MKYLFPIPVALIGANVNAYADKEHLTEVIADFTKFETYTYSQRIYYKIGEKLATAFEIGKQYKK